MSVWTVTGYKPFELGIFKPNDPGVLYIKKALEGELRQLLDAGLEWVIINGKLGVECWAAEVTLDLKKEFPDLKLAVITPFLHQEEKWKDETKEYYHRILARADFVESVSKEPYQGPWQFRNSDQFLLQKTEGLLLFYDEEKEGSSGFFLKLAKSYQEKHPYEIRQITFDDMKILIEEEQRNKDEWH
ncbi:putative phage-like protein YoqJ [Bacillus ectoiniformans]|uniref:DUF1273 domain-containing protein n=1 Tax=Bacillus ectoiniformans TaxID=1494429 RepID=UPI001956EF0B|nr:DUF1273 domain-containing protein [Bacillus ectoiniformans]MBM7647947.1 putative phage-like protein YoqJ [Bacillus ectoiniformans]